MGLSGQRANAARGQDASTLSEYYVLRGELVAGGSLGQKAS